MRFTDKGLEIFEVQLKDKGCSLRWSSTSKLNEDGTLTDLSGWYIDFPNGSESSVSMIVELTITHNMKFWEAFDMIMEMDSEQPTI